MATAAAAASVEVPSAAAAAVVTAATVAAAGSSGRLAGNCASATEAGSSCRTVVDQWEEAARLLGLRWTTYGAQLP